MIRNKTSGLAAGGTPSRSLRPGQDPAVHGNINDVQELGVSELPRAMLASGIPRIVIMDENAVYDHYMRRLNRVWMRRIQVGKIICRPLIIVALKQRHKRRCLLILSR